MYWRKRNTAGTRADKRMFPKLSKFSKSLRVFLHLKGNAKSLVCFDRDCETLFASINFDDVFCYCSFLIKVCNFLQVSIFKRHSTPSRKIIQNDK